MPKLTVEGKVNAYDIATMRLTMSMKEIAEHYGINLNSLYYWCYRNNVITKRITVDECYELYVSGMTAKEIAYEYGVGLTSVYDKIKKGKSKGGKL